MDIEKQRAFIIRFVYLLILAAIVFCLLKFALPLLTPFVLAFVFAWFLHRPIRFLSTKLRLPYKLTSLITVALFFGTVGTAAVLLSGKLLAALQTLVQSLPYLYTIHIEPTLTDLFANIEKVVYQMDATLFSLISHMDDELVQSLGDLVSSLSVWVMGAVSDVAVSLPGLFIRLVLMLIATFFLAMDYERLTGFCLRQLSGKARTLFLQIKEYIIGTLFVCIRSYGLIMTITFTELSLGLTLIGLDHAILIALCIAVFDILPVLGTGGIMIPWTVISFLQGNLTLGLSLLALYIFITVIRNILEPKIVGSQLGLHPVVTLASMFAGVQLFGVVGLFGFPICLSLLRYLNDNGTIHIFKTDEPEPTSAS